MKLSRAIDNISTLLVLKQPISISTTDKPGIKTTGTTDRPPDPNQGQNGQSTDNCYLSSSSTKNLHLYLQ